MKARLKENYIYSSMRACGGTMFNKTDWTEVPPEQVKSAIVNADLDLEPDPNEDPTLSDPYTDADPEAVKISAKKAPRK